MALSIVGEKEQSRLSPITGLVTRPLMFQISGRRAQLEMFSFAGREAAGKNLQYRPLAGGLVFVAQGGQRGGHGKPRPEVGWTCPVPHGSYPMHLRPAMPTYAEETESVKKILNKTLG